MLLKIVNNRFFKLFFFSLCFIILFSKSDRLFYWTSDKPTDASVVQSDGSGYYAFLPQWFTYGTDHFEFAPKIYKKYPNKRYTDFFGTNKENPTSYNKYYPGTAIALTPFYLIGDLHAKIAGIDQDGYSWPYMLWTNLGVIFFAVFGAYGLFRLTQLYKIHPLGSYLVVLAALFATNLCYYTTVELPFSHVFSFSLNTWFLVHVKLWTETKKNRHFYWLSAIMGWLIVIRPTNLFILVFVPFLFKSSGSFWNYLKDIFVNRKLMLTIGLVLSLLFIAVHLQNVYSQTGSFSMNSYGQEGFSNWKSPFIWDVLFSYKKGLFVYTPILFLLIPALVVCFIKQRRIFWGTLLIFSLVTYSTASWWMWFFGGGLGARNYIDFMGVFLLAIALAYQHVHWIFKSAFFICTVIGIWVYQIYDYQMRKMILHYDTVSKEGFWEVFLETDLRFQYYIVIPFDKEPKTRKNVRKPMFLLNKAKKEVRNSVLEISRFDGEADPHLRFKTTEFCNSAMKVGLEFNTDIRIYDHFTKPWLNVYLYKNDSLIESKSIQFGGKIKELHEFSSQKLFLNLNSKWNEIDSLNIWFDQNDGDAGVKNSSIQFYSY